MTPPRSPAPAASSGAVNVLTALIEVRTGQSIAANRSWRIDTALKPLLAKCGLDTAEDLVARLLAGTDPTIGDRVVDALLNQESSFFRDVGVVESAATAIQSLAAERGAPRARIWSAGCSTGQEPLSLAMHFAEAGGAMPEIIATDVSEAALQRGRAGRYSQFEIQRGLPVRRMMRWFDVAGGDWAAKPELLRLVAFRRQNLIADRPPVGPFDAIFCRNVLFYLTPVWRSRVLDSIADVLAPDGLLVLGAGETVIGLTERFQPSRRFRGFYDVVPQAKVAQAAAR